LSYHLLSRITHKRQLVSQLLAPLGTFQLLERISALGRPTLAVITYHRIAVPGIEANPYFDPVISTTPDAFEDQMRFLARQYRILGINDIYKLRSGPVRGFTPLSLLITFDDAYRDNFDSALPVLHKLGVPATFFIPTAHLSTPQLPWWDHVAYVVKRTQVTQLVLCRELRDRQPMRIDLRGDFGHRARMTAVTEIVHQFLTGTIPNQEWFLRHLGEQAEVRVDGETLATQLFMSWNQVRQLADAGMSVGAHGHHHLVLAALDRESEDWELRQSKRLLEVNLHREVAAIAYPYGWDWTFSARTIELATMAGYRLAFSSVEGVNNPGSPSFQPLAIRRLTVGIGDSSPLLRARIALHASLGRSFL
jgi:peptidoglycan/xylan/chitin deacetylase (PgdA/CDA1 family)